MVLDEDEPTGGAESLARQIMSFSYREVDWEMELRGSGSHTVLSYSPVLFILGWNSTPTLDDGWAWL